ncbi:MAG TPA: phosphoribosyltransferase [Gemmatimonadaceae bacterium]|nr:phosphoribosyltransferase [Gemmatimonadaceae bacterium]
MILRRRESDEAAAANGESVVMERGGEMDPRFRNRREAGRRLASRLVEYADRDDVLVAGLPRGGVPVAFEVARVLRLPLDIFVVRKLGVPGHEEMAMGAIASGGTRVIERSMVAQLRLPPAAIERVAAAEQRELERREQLYRGGRPFRDVRGWTVIVVDDGLATGATMAAGVAALRQLAPSKIIVAAAVAAPETCVAMRRIADECICVLTPEPLYGVGPWYLDFRQTSDAEVRALMEAAERTPDPPHHAHG